MSQNNKLFFAVLDIAGGNFLPWKLDTETLLTSLGLEETVVPENKTTKTDKAKALLNIRLHLHANLKNELTLKDPALLWKALADCYDHHKKILLPRAEYEWGNLRFQDFASATEYNSALQLLASRLDLCGKKKSDLELIEKTLSTFHPSQVLLSEAYRDREYTKYPKLMQTLLVAEQNTSVLLQNSAKRPPGTVAHPEANFVSKKTRRGARGRGGKGNRESTEHHGRGGGRQEGTMRVLGKISLV